MRLKLASAGTPSDTPWISHPPLILSPPPATASAEGAQLNGRPFPATASAEGRQFNGAPSLQERVGVRGPCLSLIPPRPITPRWQLAISCGYLCQQLAHAHGEGHTVPAIACRYQHTAVLVYTGNDRLAVVR